MGAWLGECEGGGWREFWAAAHRWARGLGKAATPCRAQAQPRGPARSLAPWSPGWWAGAGPGQGVHGDHTCLPEPPLLSQRTRRVKKLNSRDVTACLKEQAGWQGSGGCGQEGGLGFGHVPVGVTGDPRPGCQWSASASARPCRERRWSAAGEAPARGQFSLVSSFSSPPGVHSDPQLQPSPRRRAELGCAVLMSGSTPPRC